MVSPLVQRPVVRKVQDSRVVLRLLRLYRYRQALFASPPQTLPAPSSAWSGTLKYRYSTELTSCDTGEQSPEAAVRETFGPLTTVLKSPALSVILYSVMVVARA